MYDLFTILKIVQKPAIVSK